MSFSSEKELVQVRKRLEKVDGFLTLDPEANELAKFRYQICQSILKFAHKKGLSTTEMAEKLRITVADTSRIFNHRIDRFSTDKLLKLYAIIKPNYKLKVS